MSFRSNNQPFFDIFLSFHSILIINRFCHSSKILHLIRSHFSLLKNSLPIILYEITTNKEILLTDEREQSSEINSGIYLAFIKFNQMKYQPLMDLKLIPREIFPEKKFLPKSSLFIIYELSSFAKILANVIDYMIEYDKTKNINLSSSRTSTALSSPDFLAASSSIHTNHEIDIRKYIVTDPERINNNSLSFHFRLLRQDEQIFPSQIIDHENSFSSNIDLSELNNQFNENDLVLFKQHFSSSFSLELKNCLHQLAIDGKLEITEIRDILIQLNHNKNHSKIIRNLQNAALNNQKQISGLNLSNLLKILLRIDQLEKFNKLDKQTVQIFNQRMNHLAHLGILNQQPKLLKKLFQLDLFNSEPNQQIFSQFIHNDLQHIIPKQIPLNSLGMKEIIHQLYINIDRLGIISTLILIDNLQQFVHSGLLFILNKLPQFKQYLILFIEHIQTGRFIGVYLQRLMEQMNNSVQINTTKKSLLTNQLNSLLQKTKLISKNTYEKLISILINLAYQGRLNTYSNINIQSMEINEQNLITVLDIQTDIDENNLQSLLLFLHEQSSIASPSGPLPYQSIYDFIQYLRHFAQLGILSEPKLSYILTNLHKFKDENHITSEKFKIASEQMKTIDYIYAYHHLNLIEFNQFLNEMINKGNLTHGQAWYILNRLIDLCRIESITNYDIKTFLTNIQLEYNFQQEIYPKLIYYLDSLAESYSASLLELHLFEDQLEKYLFSTNNLKRIPDDIRKRLNEILLFCKQIRSDRRLVEEFFGEKMNSKYYNKIKEIFKTKNFLQRKQSLNAIIQIHKYFLQISRLNSLSDRELDLILHNIQIKYPKQQKYIEDMAKLGHLQEKSFVDYLIEHFLSDQSSSSNREKCPEIGTWPFPIDHNHPNIRHVIKHLTQLENQDQIDTGTLIEIQNRLNQLARFNKCSCPQIKLLIDKILQNQGKKSLSDKDGFQLIQSYRLILNDLIYAIELEFSIQKLVSEYQISDYYNYYFRDFLHRVLQNELSIDELIFYRRQLKQFHQIKYTDIEEIKKFIDLLPKSLKKLFPLTLTDKLLERLKWDGKKVDKSIRDQLLKFERSGVLSQDTFEEISNNLHRSTDLSFLSKEHNNHNQLFYNLFDKINDLLNDNFIDFQQSIRIKEELYLLEDMIDSIDLSQIITIQSRLFNSSNQHEFQIIAKELTNFIYQEQFRLSKAQDLISNWHLNEEKGNIHEKQILKLLHELANFNQLYNNSTILILNRYISIKPINQTISRNLIKDLQRFKDQARINQQAIECIRSIEIQLYKIDSKKRLNEFLIKNLENHLKEIFNILSHSFEQQFRLDICKKLNELLEIYIKSNLAEYSSEQFLTTFDSYITQIKQGQIRPSKTRYHHGSSEAIVPTMSPSLQSLQSIR